MLNRGVRWQQLLQVALCRDCLRMLLAGGIAQRCFEAATPGSRFIPDILPCRDAAMRLELLQMLDHRLEGGSIHGEMAEAILGQALAPCLVWRAGKIAAATRFAAITAVATVFRAKLVSSPSAAHMLHQVYAIAL